MDPREPSRSPRWIGGHGRRAPARCGEVSARSAGVDEPELFAKNLDAPCQYYSVTRRCSKYRSKSICKLQRGLFNRGMPQHTTQTTGSRFSTVTQKMNIFKFQCWVLKQRRGVCDADPGLNMKCTFKKLGSASEAF